MAEVIKINSKKGLVTLDQEDISTHDLVRWLRNGNVGFGKGHFIDQMPFERTAAKLYVEKFPSESVKTGKPFYNSDGSVTIYLAVASDLSREHNKNNSESMNQLVFRKQPKTRAKTVDVIDAIPAKEASDIFFKVISVDNVSDNVNFLQPQEILTSLLKHANLDNIEGFYNGIPWTEECRVSYVESNDKKFAIVYDQNKKTLDIYHVAEDDKKDDFLSTEEIMKERDEEKQTEAEKEKDAKKKENTFSDTDVNM